MTEQETEEILKMVVSALENFQKTLQSHQTLIAAHQEWITAQPKPKPKTTRLLPR